MASCGLAHLSGDRVDQVQTIRQMSSVWLWEAVQRVLKATFELFCIWRLCLALDCTVNRSSLLCTAGKRVHITFIAVSLVLKAKHKVILIFVNSVIICTLNLQCESRVRPHFAILAAHAGRDTPDKCHASCTIVTHYVWLPRTNHEAAWNVKRYARVCSQRQVYLS